MQDDRTGKPSSRIERIALYVSLVGSVITIFSFTTGIVTLSRALESPLAHWTGGAVTFLSTAFGRGVVGLALGILKFLVVLILAILPPVIVIAAIMSPYSAWQRALRRQIVRKQNSDASSLQAGLSRSEDRWFRAAFAAAFAVSIAWSVYLGWNLYINPKLLALLD